MDKGSVVRLKSGEPNMTVTGRNEDGTKLDCSWFDVVRTTDNRANSTQQSSQLQAGVFPAEALLEVPPQYPGNGFNNFGG